MMDAATSFSFSAQRTTVVRVYNAALQKLPTTANLDTWVSRYRSGMSLATLGQQLVTSTAFKTKYGNLSNGAFIQLAYRNAVGRAPSTTSYNTWLGRLNSGTTRGTLLVSITESTDGRAFAKPITDTVLPFRGALGRVPTTAERDLWVARFKAGTKRVEIYTWILTTPEYDGRV